MKSMNLVIAAMMMAITTAMPAMAGNKNHTNNKKGNVVTVNHKTTVSTSRPTVSTSRPTVSSNRPTVSTNRTTHFDAHKKNAYRPEVKTCTFKVSRHDSHKKVVAKTEHMKGVMDTKWNPRTRELTVIYDAKITSARHILHFVA